MADIVIRGIEVSENLDIIRNGNKIVYSKNNGMTWKEAADCIVLPEGHGRLGDLDKLKKLTYEIKTNRGTYQRVLNIVDLLNASTIVPAEGDGEDG